MIELVQARARIFQERLAMDRLARTLLGESDVVILDEALYGSWQRWRGQGAR